MLVVLILIPINVNAQIKDKSSVLIGFKTKSNNQLIKEHGGNDIKEIANINVISAIVPQQELIPLRNDNEIDYIEENGKWSIATQTVPWNIEKIDADDAVFAAALGVAGLMVAAKDRKEVMVPEAPG